MKVWVCSHTDHVDDGGGTSIEWVFSTKEVAEEWLFKNGFSVASHDLEEFEVIEKGD
jgi:hypothetical protein